MLKVLKSLGKMRLEVLIKGVLIKQKKCSNRGNICPKSAGQNSWRYIESL